MTYVPIQYPQWAYSAVDGAQLVTSAAQAATLPAGFGAAPTAANAVLLDPMVSPVMTVPDAIVAPVPPNSAPVIVYDNTTPDLTVPVAFPPAE